MVKPAADASITWLLDAGAAAQLPVVSGLHNLA